MKQLRPIAEEWTEAAGSDEERLEMLERRFHTKFGYSLDFSRRRGIDPVLDFLRRRSGHCEYFASGMALLARSLDIPARVVAGYRVTEYNAVGGYYLVRDRNAHAWVEAWSPERGWVTFDPTPAAGLESSMYAQTPWGSGVWDHIASLLRRSVTRVFNLDPWTLGGLGLASLLFWIVLRWFRRRRKQELPEEAKQSMSYRDPRPSLEALLEDLESRGISVNRGDTFESLAEKIKSSELMPEAGGREAASLLQRYAQWRFGALGDPVQLDVDIESWLSKHERS